MEQKVILQLTTKPTSTTTQCLTLANQILRQYIDFPNINFARAYLTKRNNLVLETSLATRDTNYEQYFLALQQTLGNHMTIDRIDG